MTLDTLIHRDPKTCGGEPVFRGTRVTLRTVLASLADGDSVDQILKSFPTIKLDENLPDELVHVLSALEHDVETVPGEGLAGKDDAVIFEAAQKEQRTLFTQDLDFSDIRKYSPGSHAGVVLIRLRDPSRRQ